MTLPTCPACGLQQTLRAPRCARCGAPLDGSPVIPPGGPAIGAPGSDGRSAAVADSPADAPTTAFAVADRPTAEFPAAADDLTLLREQHSSWDPVSGPSAASASPWGPGSAATQGRPRGFWRRLGRR